MGERKKKYRTADGDWFDMLRKIEERALRKTDPKYRKEIDEYLKERKKQR